MRRRPADWLADGTWPTGTIVPDAPHRARVAYVVAGALADAMAKNRLTVTQVATTADLDVTTIRALLRGDRCPNLFTVAALEDALLTPIRHPHPPSAPLYQAVARRGHGRD